MVPITGSYNLLPSSESTNKSRKFIFNLRCAKWFTTILVPLLNNELIQSHIDVSLQRLLNALFFEPRITRFYSLRGSVVFFTK